MKISIIIRTYNESKYLRTLLSSIKAQKYNQDSIEIVVVDSGSSDGTLEIAAEFNAHIVLIPKESFTFGRSLNLGCVAASGELLVFISGHCIPLGPSWLSDLVHPLVSDEHNIAYVYGAQRGVNETKFSEKQIFAKYYPRNDDIPQNGFFCNNANAAIKKKIWNAYRFDENLTGLEDMDLAKKLIHDGFNIGYVASAGVAHIHHETWAQVKRRFEREAIALQKIMPEVQISLADFFRFFLGAIFLDSGIAMQDRCFMKSIKSILAYRFFQYWGGYIGNHEHRILSRSIKERFFYPK